jgi:septum site-determining protein MinD
LSKVIVVTSGKGGVGKTTSAAALGTGLALRGKRTAVVDFDVGLRNLDLIMGCERRVVFDFVNVIHDGVRLNQALIKDKRVEGLYILPASQTKDKEALSVEGVGKVIDELRKEFEYVICDSPAGIEKGAQMALYFADEAVVVTNPEVSSVRDSDRIIGILNSKSKRAESGGEPMKQYLLLTRYDLDRVERGEMLTLESVIEILAIPVLGVIPQDEAVLQASNVGMPVILDERALASKAYADAVARLLGEKLELRFVTPQRRGLLDWLWRRSA